MAKKSSNKKRDAAVSMEISTDTNLRQAIDTSEATVLKPVLGVVNRKIKKAAPLKRSKNLRKMKAIEKAISKSEQSEEKISKNKIKTLRIQSAKTLYD